MSSKEKAFCPKQLSSKTDSEVRISTQASWETRMDASGQNYAQICNFSEWLHFHRTFSPSPILHTHYCKVRATWMQKKRCHMNTLTHTHTKQHTPTLLQLYQHLRLVRLQLVLDEWAHKMPLSHFPCCQISQQSERNEFSLWRDWDKDDGGGGGGTGGTNINHLPSSLRDRVQPYHTKLGNCSPI